MSKKKWKYAVGEKGRTVTVYEREPGGLLYARAFDSSLQSGKGGYRRVSLGLRDKEWAKTYALEQATRLNQGCSDLTMGKITLARLVSEYWTHRSGRKSTGEQKADRRRGELWIRVLGAEKDPHKISLREWESFIDARQCGAINARGEPMPAGNRRPVRNRTVEEDLKWLKWVLNWGTKWRTMEGQYLMRENPVRGFDIPTEKNPMRPVATQDRYEAIRSATDQVMMEIRWNGKREEQRSYLSEIFDIANGTGRRLSAVCKLTFVDLRLDEGPHGSIRWPASTDKVDRESTVPISPCVRASLDRVLSERPGIGAAPLFPSPGDPTKPMTRHLADKWLRKAEELAGVEPQKGTLWHAYRRKWATERKHLSDTDVAAAGGWTSSLTLKRVYQQSDAETMLQAVLGGSELREKRG